MGGRALDVWHMSPTLVEDSFQYRPLVDVQTLIFLNAEFNHTRKFLIGGIEIKLPANVKADRR